MGRTPGGSPTIQVTLSDIMLTLVSDGAGKLLPATNKLTLAPGNFNAISAALKLLYDRARIVAYTFHFVPAAALSNAGSCVMFIDYNNDTTVDTYAKAVRTQGAKAFSPWEKASVSWAAQGPNDFNFVASTATAFNPTTLASLQFYGEGLGTTIPIGYVHATAIIELTGRQTA